MSNAQRQLAVLGAPVGHSLSPALHRAAYSTLGLDWTYTAIEVTESELAAFLASRGSEWRGLSLTMPLKRTVIPLLDSKDEIARLTGGVNTVLFDDYRGDRLLRGFNTDVYGVIAALYEAGVDRVDTVRVLGSGATAASVLAAVARLGARRVDVVARTPAHALRLQAMGAATGVDVRIAPLGTPRTLPTPDAVINTIPGGAEITVPFVDSVMASALLFEVTYDPWPTPLAASWLAVKGRVVSGIEMLLHQALIQVRIFVAGDPGLPLAGESAVLAAMRTGLTSQ